MDAGHRKPMELEVVVPVEDMAELSAQAEPSPAPPLLLGPSGAGQSPAQASIWPSIHPRLLELIRAHRSTIVFVNARRLAERLASRLNELAGEDLVRAHHGALAREQRLEVEDALKSGTLRAIVATSSLELGIDMGAVDLVIQVESPGSVASGLQRIGRAGHQVGEPSRGKIFPKFRGDLLEASVVAERMLAGKIEETRYPRNPLDVLAQQLVAMCAVDEWRVDDLYGAVRRAANFAELSREVFEAVLDLLAGRYPSDGFAELRPRVVWDRVNDVVRARDGAGRLAITSGGTIPDRGLFGVFLPDGTRVGELDEEMVYESRRGEVFLLGASSWRIEDITRDRVVVTPAPGEPGKMPFWKGDKPGRPLELGRAIGAFTRELRGSRRAAALARLQEEIGLDAWAAENLVAYLDDQLEATGAVPDDRTVVVERFRDEIGDWRMCILSPFGQRVHAPWGLAIEARLLDRFGPGAQVLWSDDGIVIRLPEAVDRIPLEDLLFEPEDVEAAVVAALPGTALFASVFREASARALLLPRQRPGRRTPLWQQRQRSADLLAEAAKHPTFPMLLETTRECLRDIFDVPALREVMADLRSRTTKLVAVDTERASPFAQSLLFRWVAIYMYEGDAPLAERRAAALALDRDLLRELLGTEELRELLDAEALDQLELELQRLADGWRVRGADGLHDLLREVGDLREDEIVARAEGDPSAWIGRLLDEGRAMRVRVAGEERVAAVDDAARLRDALGVSLPQGLPAAFTGVDRATRSKGWSPASPARTGRSSRATSAARVGVAPDRIRAALEALEAEGRVTHGEFRPSGVEREWCDVEILRRIRRRSLAALRKEVEPVDAATLGRFLPAWQGADRPRGGVDALTDAVTRLQGAALPASILETDVLPARVQGFRPADLDALCAGGELLWIGAGALGGDDGRVILCFRDQARALLGGARTRRRRSRRRPPRRAPRASGRARRLLLDRSRPGRRHRRRAPPARRALGPGLGRRGHERHDGAAACLRARGLREGPDARARHDVHARVACGAAAPRPERVAGRWWHPCSSPRRAPPRPRTRARSNCSIATASSPASPSSRRTRRAGSRASTPCSRRWRSPGRCAAATSSPASGPRSSPCRERWIGSAPSAMRGPRSTTARSPSPPRRCSPRRTPPSPTAPPSPGPTPPDGRRARRAPTSCWPTARPPRTSSAAPEACSRSRRRPSDGRSRSPRW